MSPEIAEKYIGLTVKSVVCIGGGNTSSSYKVDTASGPRFLKVHQLNAGPGLFEKEANGLRVLRSHCQFIVPEVIDTGIVDAQQFIVLTWLNETGTGSWSSAGRQLAHLHHTPQPFFGFTEDNFLGSLFQRNTQHSSWADFYMTCRIMPFVSTLSNQGLLNSRDSQAAENFCHRLNELFPSEQPALLHGDLWNGNFMFTDKGPAIFDPAVYYGHREMDLGMTLLFGGFDKQFYEAYQEVYPLVKGWQQRVAYAQLYPILAHAIIFGETYVPAVRNILKPFY